MVVRMCKVLTYRGVGTCASVLIIGANITQVLL